MKSREDKILIVDDSDTNIHLLTQVLSADHRVYSIKDAFKTLEYVKKMNIDLILLDVEMPELDGYEVCRRLKADPETTNIPVIFVTGKNEFEDEEKGLIVGAIDYITKPFSPAIIKKRIQNHLKLKKYQDMLTELSMRDGLTGLFNKRKFGEAMQLEWNHAIRENTPLSLILIDIDYFKKFNDHYGHLEGDSCLKSVAKSVAKSLHHQGDIAARFGGEEFVCLLPGTNQSGAILIAKMIMRNVKNLNIPHEFSEIARIVTISLGVCTLDDVHDNINLDEFIHKADQLLYKAKKSGRNRICAGTYIKSAPK